MSLQLLKACLNHQFYTDNVDKLSEEFFPAEVRKIYLVLSEYYRSSESDLSEEGLRTLFHAKYPAITATERKSYDLLFDNIAETKVEEAVVQELVRIEQLKLNMTKLAAEALDIADGKHRDLDRLHSLYEKLTVQEDSDNVIPITDDLDELLAENQRIFKWRFCLDNLQNRIGGIGPGTLGLTAARPNGGKTAFLVSLIFHPQGWAKQGAKVLYLGNEEPVQRTKLRAFECLSGVPNYEFKANDKLLAQVKESYMALPEKPIMLDVVGVSFKDMEKLVAQYSPDILVIDQLDKVKVSGKYNSGHEELRQVYLQARELAKRYQCAVVGVSQASAEADGKLKYGFDKLEGSKTGKGAECDWIITIGAQSFDSSQGEDNGFRTANICKNKLGGWEGQETFMLEKEISRIKQ